MNSFILLLFISLFFIYFLYITTDPLATLPIKLTPLPDAPREKEIKSKDKLIVRKLNEITDIDLRKRKCRVIVRNLSFLGAF